MFTNPSILGRMEKRSLKSVRPVEHECFCNVKGAFLIKS
jgi:hypothetical protein